MKTPSLTRIFSIGAAGILVLSALVAVSAILSGDFSEVDAQILGTLFSLLLAGAVSISGYALVEREVVVPLGWAAVVAGAVGFVILTTAIWDELRGEELEKSAWSALALLVALLLVTTQRLLLRVEGLVALFIGTALVAGVAGVSTAAAIWAESDGGADAPGSWELAAIFWVLAVLGYMLLPVLQRFTAAGGQSTGVRVLGALDGVELVATRGPIEGIAVEAPSPGERLVLRHRT